MLSMGHWWLGTKSVRWGKEGKTAVRGKKKLTQNPPQNLSERVKYKT